MPESTAELKKKIEDIKTKAIADCPFKIGMAVAYEKDDKPFLGRVEYISYSEEKEQVNIRVSNNTTQSIGWSSSYTYVKPTDLKEIPEPQVRINEINEDLSELEYERSRLVKEVDAKIAAKKQELRDEQKTCIHIWDKGYETGEVRKHLIGESEVKEHTCQLCEIKGYNV